MWDGTDGRSDDDGGREGGREGGMRDQAAAAATPENGPLAGRAVAVAHPSDAVRGSE